MAKTRMKKKQTLPSKAQPGTKAMKAGTSARKMPKVEMNDVGKLTCKEGLEEWVDATMAATGVNDPQLAGKLLSDAASTYYGENDKVAKSFNHAMSLLVGINPRDALEGMLAVQLVGVHNAAMSALRRAQLSGQTTAGIDLNVNRAAKLLRASAALVEALNRHRSKGQQRVKVEHVHVHQGGQAIVGDVHHPGGGDGQKK